MEKTLNAVVCMKKTMSLDTSCDGHSLVMNFYHAMHNRYCCSRDIIDGNVSHPKRSTGSEREEEQVTAFEGRFH